VNGFLLVDGILLLLVTVTAVAAVVVRNLLSCAMLLSIYSLLMAIVWVNMDSVDVAFTEAAVGAGVSTVLLIGALVHLGTEEAPRPRIHWPGLATVAATGALLVYGTLDMPALGDAGAPVHVNPVARAYIRQDAPKAANAPGHGGAGHGSGKEAHHGDYFHGHVPNQVTAIIVSYRSFDTMFETAVILTAGLSLILLLRAAPRAREGAP